MFTWALRARVMRWVHAVGEFTADLGCKLYGRISSDSLIRLCTRLHFSAAECSPHRNRECGRGRGTQPHATRASPQKSGSAPLNVSCMTATSKFRPARSSSATSLIRGNLHIGSGARICGSVKSVKDVVLEDGVSVEGSLISAQKDAHWPALRDSRTGDCRTRTGHRCRNSMRYRWNIPRRSVRRASKSRKAS